MMSNTSPRQSDFQATGRESLTLLVVDDDPLMIEFISVGLEGRPIIVVGATTPESALSLVRDVRPRVVLTDLHLHEANGLDLMAAIHQIDPEIGVYIMTGQPTPESAIKALQDGADDYLHKPIPLASLHERVDGWLEEEEARKRACP